MPSTRPILLVQGSGNRIGDQIGRVAAAVRPEVHVDHYQPLTFQFRFEVALKKGGFAGTTRCGQEQAIVGVAKNVFSLQRQRQLSSQVGAGVVVHRFIGFYLENNKLL